MIIPIYNVQDYLAECLESVIHQTLKEIEIICINDGSNDNSYTILESYAKQDKRFVIINNQHKGVSFARNQAIQIAKGEYVCFMDSDDLYPSENTLLHLYQAASSHNALICGGCFSDYRNGEIYTEFPDFLFGYTFEKNGWISYEAYQFDFGFHRFLYKCSFLRENNLYYPLYKRYQDPVFFVKAMIAAQRFYAINEITYCYRVGHQSLAKWDKKSFDDQTQAMHDIFNLAKKHHLPKLHDLTALKAYMAADNLTTLICDGNQYHISSLVKLDSVLRIATMEDFPLQKHFDKIDTITQEYISLYKLTRPKLGKFFLRILQKYKAFKDFRHTLRHTP